MKHFFFVFLLIFLCRYLPMRAYLIDSSYLFSTHQPSQLSKMFRLGLAVSTALSVLLPGWSVVGDVALAEPGHMNNTCMRAYCIKFECRKNLARNKYLPDSRLVTSGEAWKEPAIFGALWSEDLLTLGKDVPRTPIRHFSKSFFLYKQNMWGTDIMVF